MIHDILADLARLAVAALIVASVAVIAVAAAPDRGFTVHSVQPQQETNP